MKSVLIQLPDSIKARLDELRNKGYTVSGFIRCVLEREFARESDADLDAMHLTKRHIERIEEAMNTDDIEQVVSVVDDIVKRRFSAQARRQLKGVRKGRKA